MAPYEVIRLNRLGAFVLMIGLILGITWIFSLGRSNSMTQVTLAGPTTSAQQQLPEQPQGITGTVLSLSGDQMPSMDANPHRSGPQPISTKIWIFSGKIMGSGSPRWSLEVALQHPNLVGWVNSNVEGQFQVGLPPGEYTRMAQYGSDLYLNYFLGDGSYLSIPVTAGDIENIELVNTENAAF